MIANITKPYPDGRTFNFHAIKEPIADLSTNTVSVIIKSWELEQDALANAENYVTFIARISHAYWSPSHLEDLETQVQSVTWEPHNSGFVISAIETLADVKERKRKEINAQRDLSEKSGFSYMGKVIDSDMTSVVRISVAVQAAQSAIQASQSFNITWTTQDNTTLALDAQQMVGMSIALAENANALHTQASGIKALIDAATTIAEVEAITWD